MREVQRVHVDIELKWLIMNYEPTERLVLYIISKDKRAFSPMALPDYDRNGKSIGDPNSPLEKNLSIIRSLKVKGLIRNDTDFNWRITVKGQIYRLTTSTYWEVIKWVIPITITIIIAIIASRRNTQAKKEELLPKQNKVANRDSSLVVPYKKDESGKTDTVKFRRK